jgi:serine protease Do
MYRKWAYAACVLCVCITAGQGFAQTPKRVQVVHTPGNSFLGVNVAEIDAERAKVLKLKEERGVEITQVEENGPAAKAGLRVGDVVLDYNGQRVEGTEQFIRMVRETPVGRQARIGIMRSGSAETITATIGSKPAGIFALGGTGQRIQIDIPEIRIQDIPKITTSWRSSTLGIEAESLESQLAEYFGVSEGVLVRSVIKGSAAEKAGLKAGDVILKVDGTKVTSPREISAALRTQRSGSSFPLTVMRERKEATLQVTIESGSGSSRALPGRWVQFRPQPI